jgi:putative tricarboxylic transport membrane protein
MQKQDWADAFLTGDQFGAFLKSEDERVAKVLKDVGLVQ